jgi:hypothetical protein
MDNQVERRPDYFVLEYSPSQDAWHIQHIEDLIHRNLLAYIDKSGVRDFMVMGVASSSEELLLLQEEIKKTFHELHPEEDAQQDTTKASLLQRIRDILKRFS